MSFQDAIERILHVVRDQNGNPKYVPYITKSGEIPTANDPARSDYNDTTLPVRAYQIHGGVDIIYGEMVNGVLKYRGSGNAINQNVSVYSPVTGKAWNVKDTGTVIILDEYGYFHIIRHMNNINSSLSKNAAAPTQITEGFLLGIMSNKDLTGDNPAIHVHYEITTYYSPTVEKYQKIDPEAFWNNYPADVNNGFFTLTGTYKKGNEFYGTSRQEILRGEGDESERDGGLNLNTNGLDNDTLSGGGGKDIIDGGSGDDKLYGGNSYGENLYYKIENGILKKKPDGVTQDADDSADTLIGGMGKDWLDGGRGNDCLYGGVATIANGEVTYSPAGDTDTSRDTLKGGAGNDGIYGGKGYDWLIGGQGNDVMDGGAGDDFLFGDLDNDTMYGGADDDTYFIDPGDGNDTIEDKQGNNTILFCGKTINFFYYAGDGIYKSPDGSLTGEMGTTGFAVTDVSNTVVTLNEELGFQWGDFGTTLITLPATPGIENTINGTDQGWQDDPPDEIYDTAADDKIFALGGDDYVLCDVGGANWILGGDGYDMVVGEYSSSCIIEGGAGSDIIFGGVNGNNQLFGDSRPVGDLATIMKTHIADGETAPDSGVRGDIVAADGENNNFLFGSNGYDIMFGFKGKDVIVAGGGNDLIIGDAGGMFAFSGDRYTWSFHIQVEFDPNTGGDKHTPVITGLTYYDMNSSVDNDDVIYAGTGNDFVDAGGGGDNNAFWGGEGNDLMYGGAGNDTYFIKYGEGTDTIIDTQGRNKIIYKDINGKEWVTDNFYSLPGGSVETADGKATLTHNSPWQIVFDDGTVIELGEGCTPENFGITLITLPANPDINNTINGTDQGWQDDPPDEIYDTAANDKIFALGGDDYVFCNVGGANWIIGGDGCDMIDGELSSSTIIEGGPGSDMIVGGDNGNNQLFGNSRGGDGDLATVMATLIAAGETASDSGVRGDIVAADGENNNFLYGLLRLPHFSEATVVI